MIPQLVTIVSILLASSLLQEFIVRSWRNGKAIEKGLTGLLFGGIGMAPVKRIIEAHAGSITLESNGGQQGGNLLFTLPGNLVVEA